MQWSAKNGMIWCVLKREREREREIEALPVTLFNLKEERSKQKIFLLHSSSLSSRQRFYGLKKRKTSNGIDQAPAVAIYIRRRALRSVGNETAILAIQIAEIATFILSGEKKTFI